MDSSLQDLADKAIRHAIDSGAEYCDARIEQQERKSVLIENGEVEYVRSNSSTGIGIRLVKAGTWSFCISCLMNLSQLQQKRSMMK